MGWGSGSTVFDGVIDTVMAHVPDVESRKAIYRNLIDVFTDADWDTTDECLGKDPAYDEVHAEMFPDEEEDW